MLQASTFFYRCLESDSKHFSSLRSQVIQTIDSIDDVTENCDGVYIDRLRDEDSGNLEGER